MPNISWSMTAQVPGGPKLSLSKTFEVGAYDVVEEVLSDTTPKTLDVQPSSSSDLVKFLIVSSTQYSENITYSVNSDSTSIKLDAPQVFLGEGAVSLLASSPPPQTITFTNNSGEEVRISILVGRNPVSSS
jgi:hypothetical protein